jgi:molybdate transport system substrate-binding protein
MMNRRSFLLTAAGLAAAPGAAVAAAPVTVFAAASLQESLTAAAEIWKQAAGGVAKLSFGASSAMARQIRQGAPADVFLSADLEWMDWLAERKLIVPASRRNLLGNSLVLIAPAGSKTTVKIGKGMALAKALGSGRLSVADTTAVPAGKYARTALTALGVWPSVEGKLLPGENVRAALAYVSRGEAPLGIVYATDAKADPKVRVVGTFPPASHPAILYPGAVLTGSRNAAAASFLGFLQGPQASAVFRKAGFNLLARPG